MKATCPNCHREIEWSYAINGLKECDITRILFTLNCDCGHELTYPITPKKWEGTNAEFEKKRDEIKSKEEEKSKMHG